MKHQYKTGDRVLYRVSERSGNPDLDGWIGTVIGTDSSRIPYTVEFDEAYIGAMDDLRFGGRQGHCWHCSEEHLQLAEVNRNQTQKKQRRMTEMEMKNQSWTAEDLEKLKKMKEAGKTNKEIGQALGRTAGAISFQWTRMRRQDHAEATPSESVEDEPAGELNDLETVLAETITELKGENDGLLGEIADLMQERAELRRKNAEQAEQLQTVAESNEKLKAELADHLSALASTEEQLDETMRERNTLRKTLQQTQRQLAEREQDYRTDTEQLYQYKERVKSLERLIFEKDERQELLADKLERATGVALGVMEKLLVAEGAI